jgi:hypothetical protein
MTRDEAASIAEEYLRSVMDVQASLGYETSVPPDVYGDALSEATEVFEGFVGLTISVENDQGL